jgi:16S rRNA (guanine966-N2)-methyltransferase
MMKTPGSKTMRVIAGEFRSRKLQAPPGSATRPTSDRLRETLFNVLESGTLGMEVKNSRFADLYAGSGAVGIEAASRGAQEVLLVENAPPAIAAAKKNIETLGLGARVKIDPRKVQLFTTQNHGFDFIFHGFDFIFLDPPYEAESEYALTMAALGKGKVLNPKAVVIAEHARRSELAERYGKLRRVRVLLQGDAALSFYLLADTENAPPV